MAVLEAKRTSLLSAEYWINNILAGVIVCVVVLPPAMASPSPQGLSLRKVLCGFWLVICLAVWWLCLYRCYCPHCYQYSQWCG